MPAKSKSQQRLFGLALSVKRGDTPKSEVSKDVLDIVNSMSEKEIEKYAGTKHKNLKEAKTVFKNYPRDAKKNVIIDLGVKWYEDDDRGARGNKLTVGVGLLGSAEIKKVAPRFNHKLYDITRLSNGNAGLVLKRAGQSYVNAKTFGNSYNPNPDPKFLEKLIAVFKKLTKQQIQKESHTTLKSLIEAPEDLDYFNDKSYRRVANTPEEAVIVKQIKRISHIIDDLKNDRKAKDYHYKKEDIKSLNKSIDTLSKVVNKLKVKS